MRIVPWLLVPIFVLPLAVVANAQEINWQNVTMHLAESPLYRVTCTAMAFHAPTYR
jgi:hypothetical protein